MSFISKTANAFLDGNQVIRCGGWIRNGSTTELSKFPLLLPANCRFSELLIIDIDDKLHHGGVRITVTVLCQTLHPAICQEVVEALRHL